MRQCIDEQFAYLPGTTLSVDRGPYPASLATGRGPMRRPLKSLTACVTVNANCAAVHEKSLRSRLGVSSEVPKRRTRSRADLSPPYQSSKDSLVSRMLNDIRLSDF